MIRPASVSPPPWTVPVVRAPRGFTIVELLVVVAIMLGLFGLILVGARPSAGGELRRVAQQFASLLLAAQSRAIGNPAGSAVVLGSGGVQCTSVFAGDKPPFVVGRLNQVILPANPTVPTDSAKVEILPTNGGDLQQGYRIQFFDIGLCNNSDPTKPCSRLLRDDHAVGCPYLQDGPKVTLSQVREADQPFSAWFDFQPPGTVSLRTDDGQSFNNTLWPAPFIGLLRARIACYPAKGLLAMEFPKTAGIDLRYSGTGDNPATEWGGLSSKGDLAVSFDPVGSVDALIRGIGGTAAARQPVEPVYFLVATRADINANQALASDRSLWVAIQPQTGRVTVSSNIAQPGTDQVAVRDARANARAAIAAGK